MNGIVEKTNWYIITGGPSTGKSKTIDHLAYLGYLIRPEVARILIDGAKAVYLYGEEMDVRAKVYTINGFSAHAGRDELLSWHKKIDPEITYLVHGSPGAMASIASELKTRGYQMKMPKPHENFNL